MTDRVVVLIDMDCFYCQVETRLNPSLAGKPLAVVQYNQWKGGGIIAVNYEARDRGVTRHMRGEEAKQHCPEICLVTVPTVREKADLTRYRDAGREVLSVFCQFSDCVQRASIDEAFIDLTSSVNERMMSFTQFDAEKWKSTYVVGYAADGVNNEDERVKGFKAWLDDSESIHNTPSLKLALGALIVEEMRAAVFQATGFRCSAGIAHNKILAKLACGLHKPNRQTVLPQESVELLYKTLPIKKVRNLGGKFGNELVEQLGCKTMSDLAKFSESELQARFDEKNGTWLYNISRGYDFEKVEARLVSKSIGCCKKFPGKQALIKTQDVLHWLTKLSEELSERLLEDETMNKRKANLLTISTALEINYKDSACSKSTPLTSYKSEIILSQGEALLKKICKVDPITNTWHPPIKSLGLSAGKFSEAVKNRIDNFLKTLQGPAINGMPSTSKNMLQKMDSKITPTEIKKELSFFEKKIIEKGLDSAKKLSLTPDLSNKSDVPQCSLMDEKEERLSGGQKELSQDSVKRNLFSANTESSFEKPCNGFQPSATDIAFEATCRNHLDGNKLDSRLSTKAKTNIGEGLSIISYFEKSKKNEVQVKPEEIFPDISQVDEEVLALFPQSFREKILLMKKDVSVKTLKDQSDSNQKEYLREDQEAHVKENMNINSKTEKVGSDVESGRSLLEDNNLLVKCEECGENVLNVEEHMDMHYAKKLHKELNSHSTVLVIKSNEKEKRKKKGNNKSVTGTVKKMKSIDTFFISNNN